MTIQEKVERRLARFNSGIEGAKDELEKIAAKIAALDPTVDSYEYHLPRLMRQMATERATMEEFFRAKEMLEYFLDIED